MKRIVMRPGVRGGRPPVMSLAAGMVQPVAPLGNHPEPMLTAQGPKVTAMGHTAFVHKALGATVPPAFKGY